MIEHVLADEDLDESDVQPAPKLMEIVLQNCRGRVDAVVAPYLTLALRSLHASRSPYMQVCGVIPCQLATVAHCTSDASTAAVLLRLGIVCSKRYALNEWKQFVTRGKHGSHLKSPHLGSSAPQGLEP